MPPPRPARLLCRHFYRAAPARHLHQTEHQRSPPAEISLDGHAEFKGQLPAKKPPPTPQSKEQPPLSILPLTSILRSYLVTAISSSPLLLPPSLTLTTLLANSTNPLLNPDKNPLLHRVLKSTFYAQFCAGETPQEVRQTIHRLKGIGLTGVILGYAKEVVLTDADKRNLSAIRGDDPAVRKEITAWAEGTLETVRIAEPGDFVALKFTGAGRQALYSLAERLPPSPVLAGAIDSICQLAMSRGIRLLFDAEQQSLQPGIDEWTMAYMRKYNAADKAVVYGTYQAYLKSTPATLAGHLRTARDEGFSLGVKLVRGAYLGSDPRQLIHDTKADTDAAYDGIAEALLTRRWGGPLPATVEGEVLPHVNLVLASHNAETVRRARALVEAGAAKTDVAFGQLQGMADQISCELVCRQPKTTTTAQVQAYKYLVWGSAGECMKYLLRRANENRDAVERTRGDRNAMVQELWRRFRRQFRVVFGQ